MKTERLSLTVKELNDLLASKSLQVSYMSELANNIAKELALLYGYSMKQLRSRKRDVQTCLVRSIIMWYLRVHCGMPYTITGRTLCRHHATAIHYTRCVTNGMRVKDKMTAQALQLLRDNQYISE